ncbi:MAG: hypothetical protein P8020_18125 [Acidobacteriota bacterium]
MFRILCTAFLGAILASATAVAGIPSRFFDFAHVVDGEGARTFFLVMNKGTDSAHVTLTLMKNDGSPLTLDIDGTSTSTFEFDLPAGGSRRMASSGASSPLASGWAQLRADHEVGAQELFQISSGGKVGTTAAVESFSPVTAADGFVEQEGGTRTGIAISNLSDVGAINVRLRLIDESGQELRAVTIELGPSNKVAKFLDELFSDLGDFRGTLRIEASGPFSAVILQQTGVVLGTLPPLEIF